MTQLEALDDLIQVVKAGRLSRISVERMSRAAGLPEAGTIYGSAYQGDLNAARMIHEALLPYWGYAVSPKYAIVLQPNVPFGVRPNNRDAISDMPATAWLLASLQAFRSTLVAS